MGRCWKRIAGHQKMFMCPLWTFLLSLIPAYSSLLYPQGLFWLIHSLPTKSLFQCHDLKIFAYINQNLFFFFFFSSHSFSLVLFLFTATTYMGFKLLPAYLPCHMWKKNVYILGHSTLLSHGYTKIVTWFIALKSNMLGRHTC